jgi:hypothetical protein
MLIVRVVLVLALWPGAIPVAEEARESGSSADWTNPLFAAEMYARYSSSLEKELVAAGRTSYEADYLVFRMTADIALCATVLLAENHDPAAGNFLRLLEEKETYGVVIDELSGRYSPSEFWNLMAVVDESTAACFERSFRGLGLSPE